MDIDISLDDIISEERGSAQPWRSRHKRRFRGRGRGRYRGSGHRTHNLRGRGHSENRAKSVIVKGLHPG